ncbi:unnamed protein product [Diatraea saccharalis]|uniref:DUF7869 domain-containing protein n=1 Tax=Diatraea saccharalis TaxID=40085 RepID=A0A9N9N2E1_9NEOP|nr:unnamed protein product [Diatraea saccharalis]
MEIKRNAYFKKYAKSQSSEKEKVDVTKLRHANTMDYLSIQDHTHTIQDDDADVVTSVQISPSRNPHQPDITSNVSNPIIPYLESSPVELVKSDSDHASIQMMQPNSTPEHLNCTTASELYNPLVKDCSDQLTFQSMLTPKLQKTIFEKGASNQLAHQFAPAAELQQSDCASVTSEQLTSALQLEQRDLVNDALEQMLPESIFVPKCHQSDFGNSTSDPMSDQLTLTSELRQPEFEDATTSHVSFQPTPNPDFTVSEYGNVSGQILPQITPASEPELLTENVILLSREEEIEVCLQQIHSNDKNDQSEVNYIRIELEEDTNGVLEKNDDNESKTGKETYEEGKKNQKKNSTTKRKYLSRKGKSKKSNKLHEIKHKKADDFHEKPGCSKQNTENIQTRLEKKQERIIKHIDFLSDDEMFTLYSSSWDESDESDSSNISNANRKIKIQTKNMKKAEKGNKDNHYLTSIENLEKEINTNDIRKKQRKFNKRKDRSFLKRSGKRYITMKGKVVDARSLKENPCKPNGKCPNECYTISEERRKTIFDHYWSLSVERQRDWIVSHIKKETVKRKRTKDIESRRQFTYRYCINDGEGQRPVCMNFFMNTLDVRQRNVHLLVSNSEYGSSKSDKRGRGVPANKTPPSLINYVREYLQELPAVPSHYCRKNSNRVYLPQEYKNLTNLYKLYKLQNIDAGKEYVGEKVFRNIFNTEFNISFHVPRKDKCVKCIKYENSSEEFKEEKTNHLQDKEETYSRFQVHQDLHNHDSSVLCSTFDLQKVLNTPYGESMLLYYSRKIATYNLTFYESVTREGFCFLWNEVEGKRGANEICTILAKYIKIVDERKTIKHLLLYCDACPGQNKNKIILACISKILNLCKNIMTIQINYLLPGHTFMPVDSMHSVIEKSVTNTIIWAPSQWPTVCSLARKAPKPYEVEVLCYKDFEGWDTVSEKYFKGNLTGKISKIRIATFKKNNLTRMEVKYSMCDKAKSEYIDIIGKIDLMPKKIYKTRLPISKKKYNDLEKLCKNRTIPAMYIPEYESLPQAANIQDCLPDTDVEDTVED